ncbi:hypothetical protein [Streptomyces sp. NBC_00273]|uniref:hypothetical protein n=1 Tax=Streptomyces sp. NBC_00273 TaxID=2903644 RepID=UPI003FA73820
MPAGLGHPGRGRPAVPRHVADLVAEPVQQPVQVSGRVAGGHQVGGPQSPSAAARAAASPEVLVCRAAPATLITSRKPDDLDVFCTTLVKEFTLVARA